MIRNNNKMVFLLTFRLLPIDHLRVDRKGIIIASDVAEECHRSVGFQTWISWAACHLMMIEGDSKFTLLLHLLPLRMFWYCSVQSWDSRGVQWGGPSYPRYRSSSLEHTVVRHRSPHPLGNGSHCSLKWIGNLHSPSRISATRTLHDESHQNTVTTQFISKRTTRRSSER